MAVAANAGKGPLLTVEERTELVAQEVKRLNEDGTITTPIRVLSFTSLLTDLAREQKASIIVRGFAPFLILKSSFKWQALTNACMAILRLYF